MNHIIHSSEIHPLVRFAGRQEWGQMNGCDTWASDCRLFYFIGGSGRLHIEGSVYEVAENDLFILPPQCCYRFEAGGQAAHYTVNFDYVTDADTPVRALPIHSRRSGNVSQTVRFTDFPELSSPLKISLSGLDYPLAQMAELYQNKYVYFRAELSASFTLILTRIFRRLSGVDNRGGIGEIIDYVRASCAEPLTNQSIAERFHYHPNYVSRLFLLHTGQPLHRYLMGCRIEKAQLLLSSTKYPIAKIGELTGFQSPGSFSRAFRDAVGCTPSDYRR